ncbi:hypothetical protein SNE40_018962 [Patella caerulea]|uniref:Uncharacterized protein n=1 Tax=Patella caerulea TaxID=87958 RepID=A0AAN8P4X4_PATCE
MSDLLFKIRRETWAYVALLGLFAIHIGIILAVLAFEGALEREITSIMEVFGIALTFLGFFLLMLSTYLRGQLKRRLRVTKLMGRTRRNFRRCSSNKLNNDKNIDDDDDYCYPTYTCNTSKSKVFPWYSESSGPLPIISTNRHIEEWLSQHRVDNLNESQTPEDINPSRLSSLV